MALLHKSEKVGEVARKKVGEVGLPPIVVVCKVKGVFHDIQNCQQNTAVPNNHLSLGHTFCICIHSFSKWTHFKFLPLRNLPSRWTCFESSTGEVGTHIQVNSLCLSRQGTRHPDELASNLPSLNSFRVFQMRDSSRWTFHKFPLMYQMNSPRIFLLQSLPHLFLPSRTLSFRWTRLESSTDEILRFQVNSLKFFRWGTLIQRNSPWKGAFQVNSHHLPKRHLVTSEVHHLPDVLVCHQKCQDPYTGTEIPVFTQCLVPVWIFIQCCIPTIWKNNWQTNFFACVQPYSRLQSLGLHRVHALVRTTMHLIGKFLVRKTITVLC